MPAETKSWTEDKCTCGHGTSKHANGDGRCDGCDDDRHWHSGPADRKPPVCLRFQWNGEERKRTW